MTYKPVGIDENSLFPPRVEERLAEQFAPITGMPTSYVGLGNVDNTSDADKPVSTATQVVLDTKGSQADLNLKSPIESPAFTGTPTGITKAHVGLNNVDNTSDANKPVSVAQAALFVPRWKPTTAYVTGQQVVSPNNEVVSALANFTSTDVYVAANWTTPTSIGTLPKSKIVSYQNTNTISGLNNTETAIDSQVVDLIAGRNYSLMYRFDSLAAGVNNAIVLKLKKSIESDTTIAGTEILNTQTLWTAPVSASSKSHILIWTWTATVTEKVRLKLTHVVFGANTNSVSKRIFTVDDDGAYI